MVAVRGYIGVVMTVESYDRQQDLNQENPQRKDSDSVENLPLNKECVPPLSHLGETFS
jgi:hypothetical protein